MGGRKFVSDWLVEQPNMFESLVDLTLDSIGDDPDVAGDEVIQFMILASSTGPDTLDFAHYRESKISCKAN